MSGPTIWTEALGYDAAVLDRCTSGQGKDISTALKAVTDIASQYTADQFSFAGADAWAAYTAARADVQTYLTSCQTQFRDAAETLRTIRAAFESADANQAQQYEHLWEQRPL